MIAEKILGNLSESTPSVEVDTVELDWFEAEKKRIRKTTAGGRDIGIAIDENLKDGDIIYLDDKLCVAVKLTSCPLIKINVHTMQEMGRLCFEIGNRHLSLKISDDNVLIPHDEPTEKHLKKLDGECEKVAIAIDEHYKPRFAGDSQPQTTAGRIVSLADKIDTIVGTFHLGKIPTGSQDPFALRRQALGLVNMSIEAKQHLSISAVVAKSMDLYGITDEGERAKMQQDVADFLRLRLKNVLEGEKIRYDVIDSVLGDVDDLYNAFLRAQAVQKFVESAEAAANIQAFVRVANLAKKSESDKVDESLCKEAVEKSLYQAYTSTESAVESLVNGEDYTGAIDALTELAKPIDAFFDGVLVMDKDEAVKNNRLGLLKAIDETVARVADFSKIVLA